MKIINNTELLHRIKKHKETRSFSLQDTDNLLRLTMEGNYLQIIYSYGLIVANVLLRYLEENEEFEFCEDLFKTIKNYKLTSGEHLDYESY